MTSRDVMSTRRLQVLSPDLSLSLTEPLTGPLTAPDVGEVLSVHLDGAVCRVGCEFCYLGQRLEAGGALVPALLLQALERLDYREVAVAVSQPDEAQLLPQIRAAARGRRLSVTTTVQIARSLPLSGVDRVNLSVDPRKGRVSPGAIARVARRLRGAEVVLIVSLTTPPFAARLVDGLLEALVDLPEVHKVALNALKPVPAWCGRAFWMRTLARLAPLLSRALDRRLFLDCWVAARLLGLGGCPARADLTPAPGGLAFRGCVYQPAADFVAADADELPRRLQGFKPPETCPFVIPE
jgi:hypothetical protein